LQFGAGPEPAPTSDAARGRGTAGRKPLVRGRITGFGGVLSIAATDERRTLLAVEGLAKRFGRHVAVDGVSFQIREGETVGLLGPNGAGKSTTLAMINGLLMPDAGSVTVGGERLVGDAAHLKRRIGLVPQDLALYDELSAWANLELFGGLFGVSGESLTQRAGDALALVGLSDRRNDPVKGFSGGMKRRLNIAGALLHDPQLILLDEPTVGVDPQSRNAIFENLEELKRRGKTLLYTTHYMEEAERLCDRIVIIDHGRVIADDTPRGLYARLPTSREVIVGLERPPTPELLTGLRSIPGVSRAEGAGDGVHIDTDGFGAPLAACLERLAAAGHTAQSVQAGRTSLERVFIALTGHALRDQPRPDDAQ
jgi:linearmycin/streptolysin S transport system ATP-binding protein